MAFLTRPFAVHSWAVENSKDVERFLDPLSEALFGGPAVLPVPMPRAPMREAGPGIPSASMTRDHPFSLEVPEWISDEEVAAVLLTSGSTGAAKETLLSAAQLRASSEASDRRLTELEGGGPRGPAQWLLALPPTFMGGFQVLVRSVLSGTAPVVMESAERFTAEGFLDAARRMEGAVRRVSLVPTQLVRLLEDPEAVAALREFDSVLVGGAALRPEIRRRAREADIHVVRTYGMSETCGGCVYDGRPLDGVRIRIGHGGRIELGGPTVATGYSDPRLTRASFHEEGGVRWFTTDDLGSFYGKLVVLGRADDVIITGGQKVSADVVQEMILALPGVTDAVVFGIPDDEWGHRVVAAVVGDASEEEVRHACRGLGSAAVPKAVLGLEALPLLTSGKVDRGALAAMARAKD